MPDVQGNRYVDNLLSRTSLENCKLKDSMSPGYYDGSAPLEAIEAGSPVSLETGGFPVAAKMFNAAGGDVHVVEPHRSAISTYDHDTTLDQDLLGDPERHENFSDTLKKAVQKLKQNNWESSVSALLNIVHLSRIRPEMIDSNMPLITRSLHG